MMNVETDTFCAPHRVIKKDKTMACLDPNWEWAKKLLEKFNSTADGTKQMKLDYSQCPRKFVPKKPPAVSQHHKILWWHKLLFGLKLTFLNSLRDFLSYKGVFLWHK